MSSYLYLLLETRAIFEIIAFVPGDDTFILDLKPRLLDCDFILNRLYFFWTNFFYLYSFLNVLMVSLIIHKFLYKAPQLLFWLVLLLLSNHMLVNDYWFLNLDIKYLGAELLNPLLLNSINKFHPLLFYMTTLLVVIYSLKSSSKLKVYTGASLNQEALIFGLQMLLFTLFLGSWWALQEGSWGGWWNWDPSEVLGLVVVLKYLTVTHSKKLAHLQKKSSIYLTFTTYSLVTIYLLIQLNFDLVSHNFGTRTNAFTNILEVLSLEMLILLILLPAFILSKFKLVLFRKNLQTKLLTYNSLLFLLTTLLLYFSFKLLITDSLWQFILFNSSNYLFNLQLAIVYLSVVLILYIWGLSVSYALILIPFYYATGWLLTNTVLVLSMLTLINTQHLLHGLIIFFIYFNMETYFKSILLFSKNGLLYNYYVSFTDSMTHVTKNLIHNYTNSEKSAYMSLDGATDSQWFSKLSTGNFIEQILKGGSINLKFNVHIFEFGHMNLLAIFASTLLILFYQKNIKHKITF